MNSHKGGEQPQQTGAQEWQRARGRDETGMAGQGRTANLGLLGDVNNMARLLPHALVRVVYAVGQIAKHDCVRRRHPK